MTSDPQESAPPPESAASSSVTSSAADAAKARIKIGTQRQGVAAPRLPPRVKTIFQTPEPGQESAAASEPTAAAVATQPGSGLSAEPVAAAPVEPAAPDLFPKPTPIAPTQRKNKFDIVERAGEKVAPPNLRAELTPDLAQELDAALEGVSLNDLMSAESADAASGAPLEPETKTRGKVIRLHNEDVFVELPGRNQGVVSLKQFAEPPAPGAMIDVVVTRFNADEGLHELTLPGGAVSVEDWSQVAEGMVVEAHITGHNKGGLECDVSRLRGFIPLSQMALYRVEDPQQFVGQKLTCLVTEVDPERRKLVLSRRAMLEQEQAEAKKKLLAELAPGQIREGIVRNIRDFGAFVDLGGVDGLLHVGQLSWDRVKHPSDVLQVGQTIRVKIDKINSETGKISLSHRELLENPWANVATKYPVTSHVRGTVSKIMEFGAFVKLEPGVEGLIHISELAHQRVHRASDIVAEGQEVEVKVLSADPEAQRISLSLKALQARPEPAKKAAPEPEEPEAPPPPSPKRTTPLKGGLGKASGGKEFGLRW
jgi:small subunit ribosomal protein S1